MTRTCLPPEIAQLRNPGPPLADREIAQRPAHPYLELHGQQDALQTTIVASDDLEVVCVFFTHKPPGLSTAFGGSPAGGLWELAGLWTRQRTRAHKALGRRQTDAGAHKLPPGRVTHTSTDSQTKGRRALLMPLSTPFGLNLWTGLRRTAQRHSVHRFPPAGIQVRPGLLDPTDGNDYRRFAPTAP